MQAGKRLSILALALLFAVSACHDAPTTVDVEGSRLENRGQNKKNPDPPPSESGDIVGFGELVFSDANLSLNRNQSCQTCHEPSQGFATSLPTSSFEVRGSVVEGSVAGRFGDRKPPSAAYASPTPRFSGGNNPTGGLFWDGRATGEVLGSAIADQALGPFLNPVEQALPDAACVVYRVVSNASRYSDKQSYAAVFPNDPVNVTWAHDIETRCSTLGATGPFYSGTNAASIVQKAYHNIALAIAAFEGSNRVNKFSSRFDRGQMTDQELQGQQLFGGKGKCQQCHDNKGTQPLFTDFAFHNLGVPKNPNNPVYGSKPGFVDLGLAGFTGLARHEGKFRTPTIRNVGMGTNRTFMHNGALVSLEQVVDFYNTRDALPTCTDTGILADPNRWGSKEFGKAGCWPPPELPRNLDTKQMGKLGLTKTEVEAIVAYMQAMTDQ
jgi:cytochrome c peroxidase